MSLVATEPPPVTGADIMYALVLESGAAWGEVAADFQRDDVEAIFRQGLPNKHFLTRPRGGSKTTDMAGIALSWLYADSPPRGRGVVVASNAEQASILIDAATDFINNTPVLADRLRAENERIVNEDNGAWIRVLNQSEAGAWGLRNHHLLVCDEFAQWPRTFAAQRVWAAIRSTVQKTPGCRLVILTSSGDPSHWSHAIFETAVANRLGDWHVHAVPGPVPWQDPLELESLEAELAPSLYAQLVLNQWTSDEDRALTEEDYDLAVEREAFPFGDAPPGIRGGGNRLHHPRPGLRYLVTVDVGISNDATVIVVAHKERAREDGPARVVIDHVERWQGSKRKRIEIDDIRDRVRDLALEYHRAPVYADPDQFVGSLQQLRRMGVRASEWAFTATSVGQVATSLVQAFRNRQIAIPDYPELRAELLRVRLRSNTPGITRLDHEKGAHDDQAVCLGMACHLLIGNEKRSGAEWTAMKREADAMVAARRGSAERRAERAAARIIRGRARSGDPAPAGCRHGVTGRCVRCAARRPF